MNHFGHHDLESCIHSKGAGLMSGSSEEDDHDKKSSLDIESQVLVDSSQSQLDKNVFAGYDE